VAGYQTPNIDVAKGEAKRPEGEKIEGQSTNQKPVSWRGTKA